MNARFGFLLFDQFEDLDFVGAWEMLALWSQKFDGPNELFIINEQGGLVKSVKGLSIQSHTDFGSCPALDYLLVSGGQGTRTAVSNKQLISFIETQSKNCKQMLSVCTGAFLLQAAGLLTNKTATTHWASLDRLKAFTDVNVVEQRYVNDGDIWTSAGVSAGIDMVLAFIAATAGEVVAGDIQLLAEYYPQLRIYSNSKNYLPAYVANR